MAGRRKVSKEDYDFSSEDEYLGKEFKENLLNRLGDLSEWRLIHSAVATNKLLSSAAKLVYGFLAPYGFRGESYYGTDQDLRFATDLCSFSVSEALEELADWGWIEKYKTNTNNSPKFKGREIRVNLAPVRERIKSALDEIIRVTK